jgi:hypothetical protein
MRATRTADVITKEMSTELTEVILREKRKRERERERERSS